MNLPTEHRAEGLPVDYQAHLLPGAETIGEMCCAREPENRTGSVAYSPGDDFELAALLKALKAEYRSLVLGKDLTTEYHWAHAHVALSSH